jgi:dienelactone hydrolase
MCPPRGLTVLWILLLLGGCASRVHIPYDANRPRDLPAPGYQDVYHYDPGPLALKNHVRSGRAEDYYRVRYLRFAATGHNGQPNNLVTGDYYQSVLPGKKPLVIVLPIWGVSVYPPDAIAERILQRSRGQINVYKMYGENYLLDWKKLEDVADLSQAQFMDAMQETRQRLHDTGVDIRRLIDWASRQHDVDPERIAIVGFSIGAMVAASVLPHEPRLRAGVLVMGGARPQDIFSECPWRPSRAREPAKKKYGWSQQYYRKLMDTIFGPLDPARYAGRVDPAKVLIVDAREDECITRRAREALWQSMGYPERITLSYSHETAFLAMTPLGGNYLRNAIYQFLLSRFKLP